GALAPGAGFAESLAALDLPDEAVDAKWIDRPWRLMGWNSEAIASDLAGLPPDIRGDVHASVALLEPSRIAVQAAARVDPLAVLDAREGPILLRRGVRIGAATVVVGPCVVGEGTQLPGGVSTRPSIGRHCRTACGG